MEIPIRRRIEISSSLLEANRSPSVREDISQWQLAKERKQGELTLVIMCSDARLSSIYLIGNKLVASVSTIAANGETEPFKHLLKHGAIGQVLVVGHYDGEKVENGKPVLGCGGLAAKKQTTEQGQKIVIEGNDLLEYVNKIEAPDAVTQTIEIVNKITRQTDKPIFGAVVDHITYKVQPVVQSVVDPQGVRQTVFDQQVFKLPEQRKTPILVLDKKYLDPKFEKLLKAGESQSRELRKIPGFIEGQRVQNPKAVILSTSPLPIALRYPDVFGKPNSGFVVRLPFSKADEFDPVVKEGVISITKKYLKDAIAQLRYPLEHATKAAERNDFFGTNTLIIETSNLDISAEIARELMQEQFIINWVDKKYGKIIVSEVKSGQTTKCMPF